MTSILDGWLTERGLVDIHKHLPGGHDQASHGRRGGQPGKSERRSASLAEAKASYERAASKVSPERKAKGEAKIAAMGARAEARKGKGKSKGAADHEAAFMDAHRRLNELDGHEAMRVGPPHPQHKDISRQREGVAAEMVTAGRKIADQMAGGDASAAWSDAAKRVGEKEAAEHETNAAAADKYIKHLKSRPSGDPESADLIRQYGFDPNAKSMLGKRTKAQAIRNITYYAEESRRRAEQARSSQRPSHSAVLAEMGPEWAAKFGSHDHDVVRGIFDRGGKAAGSAPPAKAPTSQPKSAAGPAKSAAGNGSGGMSSAVRDAYSSLSGGQFERRVRLADLREKLGHVDRASLDKELMGMLERDEAVLMQIDDPLDIGPRDRAAAMNVSSSDRHIMMLRDPRPSDAPSGPAATKRPSSGLFTA